MKDLKKDTYENFVHLYNELESKAFEVWELRDKMETEVTGVVKEGHLYAEDVVFEESKVYVYGQETWGGDCFQNYSDSFDPEFLYNTEGCLKKFREELVEYVKTEREKQVEFELKQEGAKKEKEYQEYLKLKEKFE